MTVAEVDKEGVRLSATTWARSPAERGKAAAELRAATGCVACASTHYPQPRPERGSPPNVPMTHRQRKSRRRKRHTGRSTVLLGLGVLATVAIIALLSAVGYVLAIAASAPDLSELKPADKGQLSVVYAADGSRLGYVQSDVAAPRGPVGATSPWTCAGPPWPSRTSASTSTSGVDLNAIVRAGDQEPRVRQERAGRLDDHPAARACAVHQGPEARLRAQDPRGQAGLRARGRSTRRRGSSTTTSTPSRTAPWAAGPRSASRPRR